MFLSLVDTDSEAGKMLTGKLPKEDLWREKLKSHQFNAKDFTEVKAFYLENGQQENICYCIKEQRTEEPGN